MSSFSELSSQSDILLITEYKNKLNPSIELRPLFHQCYQVQDFGQEDLGMFLSKSPLSGSESSNHFSQLNILNEIPEINKESYISQENTQMISSFHDFSERNTAITPKKLMCDLQIQTQFSEFFYQVEEVVEYFSFQVPLKQNLRDEGDFQKNTFDSKNQTQEIKQDQMNTALASKQDLNSLLSKPHLVDNSCQFFSPKNINDNVLQLTTNLNTFSTKNISNDFLKSEHQIKESHLINEQTNFLVHSSLDDSQNCNQFSPVKETNFSITQLEQDQKIKPSDNSQLEITKDSEGKRPASGSFSASSSLSLSEDISSNIDTQVKQNILKSILNAFKSYSNKNKSKIRGLFPKNEHINNQLKQLNRYLKQHSFNNHVLKYIALHNIYSVIFKHFLDEQFSSWIKQSKILDKQAAYQVFQLLQTFLKDKESIQHLICYKATHKNKSEDRTEIHEQK